MNTISLKNTQQFLFSKKVKTQIVILRKLITFNNIISTYIIKSFLFSFSLVFFLTTITSYSQIPKTNLTLWLKADSLPTIVLNGSSVSVWKDCSGKGNDAIQSDANAQPTLVNNTLNGYPIVQFDGSNDYLLINTIAQSQPITAFVVWHNTSGDGTVWDATNRFLFRNYAGTGGITAQSGVDLSYSKSSPFTIVSSVIYNGTSGYLYENGILKVSGDIGTTPINGLILGINPSHSGVVLNGYIAEIILYGSTLTIADRKMVETYLLKKYTSAINFESDKIVKSTLCDTTIHAGPGFTSYLWNTGATTEAVTVGKGSYAVTVTDENGFPSSDSVSVSYAGTKFKAYKPVLCQNDSLYIKTALKSPAYTFHWNTGSNSDSLKIKTSGKYWATITDKNHCSVITDTANITVDIFPSLSSVLLGKDTTLCKGNKIGITNASIPVGLSYKWSTNEITTTIAIATTGTYSVTATDNNNCKASDAIYVTVSGTAPTAAFSVTSGCAGDALQYTNGSIPLGDSWLWNFGDGNSSTTQNPTHSFLSGGVYEATLQIASGNCQNTLSKQLTIPAKPSIPSLLYPAQNFIITDTIITFRWTSSPNTVYRIFELSTTANFSSIIYTSSQLGVDTLQHTLPSTGKELYWRVRGLNACGYQISASNKINFFLANTFPGMQLWLQSNNGVTNTSGKISVWKDCSGKENNAMQLDANLQPLLVPNVINGNPVLQFDGVDDYLLINTMVLSQPITAFVVWHNSGGDGTVWDATNRFLFRNYTGSGGITAQSGVDLAYSKSSPFTIVSSVIYNGTSGYLYENGILKVSGDIGTTPISGLVLGINPSHSGVALNGYIAEIILYGSALTDANRKTVENYLLKKYTQAINLGSDIMVKSTLCDTTIHAGSGFSSYLWNTGATTEAISVGKGTYAVTVTDGNGFSSSDSIIVSYAGTTLAAYKSVLCQNDSLYIKTALKSPAYNFHWNTGSIGDSLKIKTSGKYWATITDKNNCLMITDTANITVDNFPLLTAALFGKDTTLCKGNKIGITNASIPIGLSYKWSTSEITTTIAIATSGSYCVTATDNNNCKASDAIYVTVSGMAPIPTFSVTNGCVGDALQFTNSSIPLGDSWLWTFGDGNSSTTQNPIHNFLTGGIYEATLQIASGNCQNTLTKQLTVPAKPNIPSLLYPAQNFMVTDTIVTFRWKSSSNTDYRIFDLSTNADFSSIVYTSSQLGVDSLQYTFPSTIKELYWRVRAFNTCGSQVSANNKINFFFKHTFSGMQLWLKSDTGVTNVSGKISIWKDFSGKGNNAIQSDANAQPTLVNNTLNGYPIVQFDGSNDYLLINTIAQSQPITAFVVWHNTSGDGTVWDATNRFLFRNYAGTGGITAQSGVDLSYSKSSPFTILSSVIYYGTSGYLYENGILKVSGNIGTTPINGLILGINPSLSGVALNGYIAEIILYGSALTDANRKTVENYLHKKYTPTLELGSDININQSLCDTIIHAGKGFKSYLWSTGDTTESIRVKRSGKYLVDVLDEFGYTSSDDINVKFAIEPSIIKDSTICPGASFIWDTKLNNIDFSFKWSTGATTPAITIATAGNYTVTISDKGGCSYKSDTVKISIDDFDKSIDLGKDTTLCKYNEITLKKGNNRCVSYLWEDGSTNKAIQALSSGTYYVTATDKIGCTAKDSVKITVSGTAPDTKFSVIGHCEHDTLKLIDNSVSRDGTSISSYKWFIENDTLHSKNANYFFKDPGNYFVTLKTFTVSCTGEMTLPIKIDPKPSVSFKPNAVCQFLKYNFVNTTTLLSGMVKNVQWIFDDSLIVDKDTINRAFKLEGNNHSKLLITTDKNCVDSAIIPIDVKSTPKAVITNTASCERNAYNLFDKSIVPASNSITNRTWSVWDMKQAKYFPISYAQTLSFQQDSIHKFNLVKLEVKGVNGCIDSTTKKIGYNPIPKAALQIQNSCVGDSSLLIDKSTITSGNITKWKWRIGDTLERFEQNPKVLLRQSKIYSVSLRVTSEMGCEDTVYSNVKTIKKPVAKFDYEPKIVGAPVDITFNNQSDSATSYIWNFGDNSTSTEIDPIHEYADSGNYIISLNAYNDFMCADSIKKVFALPRSNFKIVQTAVLTTEKNGYVSVSTIFINAGLNPFTSIDFILTKDDGTWVKENWKGLITTGFVDTFTFASHFRELDGVLPKYICVDANVLDKHDTTVAKSSMCLTQTKELTSFSIYPNPANDKLTITFAAPQKGTVDYTIYENTGKPILVGNNTIEEGFNSVTIPISALAQGYYIWKIETGGKSKSGSFIVNRK